MRRRVEMERQDNLQERQDNLQERQELFSIERDVNIAQEQRIIILNESITEEIHLKSIDVSWIIPHYQHNLQQVEYAKFMQIYNKYAFEACTFLKIFHHQLQYEVSETKKITLLKMFLPYFIYHKIGFRNVSSSYDELYEIEQTIDTYIPNNYYIQRLVKEKKNTIQMYTNINEDISSIIVDFTGKLL